MARRARLVHPGFPLHIIQRGNNRSACFMSQTDYQVYLSMLRSCASSHRCTLHAYVLMTNHVHLLLTPAASTAAGALMKALGQQYVQFVNRKYGRTGTLWEGRFRSSIVQDDSYFLMCQRYIELNPVRAGMVVDPGDYAWSSYRANAYGQPDACLAPHDTFLALGNEPTERHVTYRALFSEQIPAATMVRIRNTVNGNFVLGSTDYAAEVAARIGNYTEPRRSGMRRH